MASSRAPKFIQIQIGDHHRSPHLSSLRSDEIDAPDSITPEASSDVSPEDFDTAQTIEMNLIPASPTARERLQQRINDVTEATGRVGNRASESFKKIHIPTIPLPKFSVQKKLDRRYAQQRAIKKIADRVAIKAPEPTKIRIPHFKTGVVFALIALLLVTPLKAITTYERLTDAQSDVEQLKSNTSSALGSDLSHVNGLITDALRSFHHAQTSLGSIDPAEEFILRHTPVFGEKFGVASRLIAAGEHTSLAAASYMQLFRTLKTKSDAPLMERLTIFFEGNRAVVNELSAAAELAEPIDVSSLPEDQRQFVTQARDSILALNKDAKYLSSAGPVILSMLGNVAPRRYLVVFQNPTELRPTGGFIGSFAIVDIKNGEVQNLQVPAGGSYDLQGSLKKFMRAPLPLHIINSRWEFQDGNWFPDFPTSAQKLMWFLEKSQGPSVDGVIAVNATLLPELLAVVGPVKISGTDVPLTADNALLTVRDSIDAAAKTKTPKEIIASAAPAVIETIKAGKSEHFLPVITTLLQGLERRDVQMYARDESLQNHIAEFGWDGAIRDNPNGDYLAVINTNIGGQKTDALVEQTIDHQAKIGVDGTVTVTVRIARKQRGSARVNEGGPNVSYLRYYVPKGSTLIRADGFEFPSEKMFRAAESWEQQDKDLESVEREIGVDPKSGTRITEEFGHTAFGNWMITDPKQPSESVISYVLPFKIAPQETVGFAKVASYFYDAGRPASYSVYLQRQSGAHNTQITSRVILPDGWALNWINDPRAQIAENGALITLPFTNDIYYGLTAYASNIETIEAKKD